MLKDYLSIIDRRNIYTLIFSVTAKCNARCVTCYYHDKLNKNLEELKLSEIEKISKSLPKLRSLLISGGEPFLKNELLEICELFSCNTELKYLSVPTNGTQINAIKDFIHRFSERHKNIILTLSVSLDGFKDTHEKSKNISGIFDSAVETIRQIKELKKIYNNLRISLVTVYSRLNKDEIIDFFYFVKDKLDVDFHNLEIIRGEPADETLKYVTPEDLTNYKIVRNKIFQCYLARPRMNNSMFFNNVLLHLYQKGAYQIQTLNNVRAVSSENWFTTCTAAETIVVIDETGYLYSCELRKKILNLRDYDFNMSEALKRKEYQQERTDIENEKCSCTHSCFIADSIQHSPKNIFWDMPRILLKGGITH